MELQCLGSMTFRRRERYRILDCNCSQPGLNYQPGMKTYLATAIPGGGVVVRDAHI